MWYLYMKCIFSSSSEISKPQDTGGPWDNRGGAGELVPQHHLPRLGGRQVEEGGGGRHPQAGRQNRAVR